jgi:hypothetical protein
MNMTDKGVPWNSILVARSKHIDHREIHVRAANLATALPKGQDAGSEARNAYNSFGQFVGQPQRLPIRQTPRRQ